MTKETKRERFVRIAETRTNSAIDAIENIGRCANRAVYEYSETDVAKIAAALSTAVEKLQGTLLGADRFRLDASDDSCNGEG